MAGIVQSLMPENGLGQDFRRFMQKGFNMHVNKAVYNYVDDDWKPSGIADFVLFASFLSSHHFQRYERYARKKVIKSYINNMLIICHCLLSFISYDGFN